MLNAAETSDVKVELATSTKAGIIKPTETEENEDLTDAGYAADAE